MVSDPLKASAHRTPDAPALDDGTRVWSYAELHAAVDRMARRLLPLGVARGETVAVIAHPEASAIQAVHAVPRTGATLALLNPDLGAAGIEAALEALSPSLVLSTAATMAADPGGLDPTWITLIDELPPADADVAGVSDESRFRLWTSGTAGSPATVDLTVGNLNASGDAVIRRLGLSPDDRWYASLSIAHVGGLALVWRAAMVGCVVVATGRYRSEELGALLTFGRVTHASLVPTQLGQILDRHPDGPSDTLRCLLIGGAPLPRALLERALEAGYPVAVTYGLTQATSQVATAPPELVREVPGTVGFPLDGLEVRLATDGEILVRGPTVAPGTTDSEGWLSTGDLARVDDLGRLWITGRKSHRIISGGVNVDPVEVEEALEAIPGVTDAVVVGLPDDAWGERVAAVVVTDGSIGEADEITSAVAERLSKAAVPRAIRLVDDIPRNANGKADLRAVRTLLLSSAP